MDQETLLWFSRGFLIGAIVTWAGSLAGATPTTTTAALVLVGVVLQIAGITLYLAYIVRSALDWLDDLEFELGDGTSVSIGTTRRST